MAKELRTLGWDYLMFVLFIAFTVFAPLWKRLFGKKKQRSKADYVFATGGVSIVAVMISIARGTLGVRTVLGYPSELFYRGSGMWEIIYGMASAYPLVCFIFVPVYFNLGITSVYQYLDLRFKSRLVRCLASFTYIIRQVCSLGVTVYTPSVALSTVIGIPYWLSIVCMSTICIFFSIKGGLKAAINADVIQTVTVVFVSVVIIIKGTIFSGGVKRVYDINRNDGRLSFFNFTGDMTVRVDTTSAWLGQLFVSLSQFGCQQNFMQRYVSLKSLKEVKHAMMSNIPIIFIFFSLSWLTGLVIYSSYADCDPLKEGYINKADEILPFYVEDQLSMVPGFLGIFMATLFNGALCMMVSNLNSLGTVISEDFLTLLPKFKNLSDKQQLHVIKIVTVICGILIMCVAFCVGLLTGVIESSMMAFSATSGPLLGCFILAMLVPIANWKGTSAGMISACAFVLWIIAGSSTIDKTEFNKFLPTSTEGCSNFTFSQSIHKPGEEEFSFLPTSSSWLMQHSGAASSNGFARDSAMNTNYTKLNETLLLSAAGLGAVAAGSTAAAVEERTPLQYMYAISYMYYSLIGTALTVFIGIVVSYLTQDPKDTYDAKLLHPLVFKFHQRFTGEKPYYVKEIEITATTIAVGSNGNINNGSSNGTGTGGGASNGSGNTNGAKINHAFEAQNETNIIIGAGKTDKDKTPMEVIFTKPISSNTTSTPSAQSSTQTPAQSPTSVVVRMGTTPTATPVTIRTTTNSNNKIQNIFSTPSSSSDNNTLSTNGVTGSYRQITEKESV